MVEKTRASVNVLNEKPEIYALEPARGGWIFKPRDFALASPVLIAGALACAGCGGGGGDSGSQPSNSGSNNTITQACGTPIPSGYTCTCNCVSTGNTSSDTLTQACGAPIPAGYTCTCNCVSRGRAIEQAIAKDSIEAIARISGS